MLPDAPFSRHGLFLSLPGPVQKKFLVDFYARGVEVEKTVNQIQNKVDQAKQEGRPGGQGGVSGRAEGVPGREEG